MKEYIKGYFCDRFVVVFCVKRRHFLLTGYHFLPCNHCFFYFLEWFIFQPGPKQCVEVHQLFAAKPGRGPDLSVLTIGMPTK